MTVIKHLSGKAVLAGLALSMTCCGISAQDRNFTHEIRLAKALNEIGLTDYADDYIEDLIKKNPGNALLEAQRIDNFLNQNKMDEAIELAKKFPAGSDAYYESLASIGTFYVSRSRFDEGIAQLKPVKDYAAQSGRVKDFKKPLLVLMTAYQKSGRAAEAQQVLELISLAEKGEDASMKREVLFGKARFALESVEEMKKRQDIRWKELTDKIAAKTNLIRLTPEQRKTKYEEMSKRLLDAVNAAVAAAPSTAGDIQKVLAQKKTEDEKYYAGLQKKADAVLSNQARMAVYEQLGNMVGISAQDMAEIAEIARIHAMNSNNGLLNSLNQLMGRRVQVENNFYNAYYNPKVNNANNEKTRQEWYKDYGRILGMSEAEILEYAGYEKVRRFQPERKALLFKGYANLVMADKEKLDKVDPMDWQDVIYKAYEALNEVMWGGQDVLTAMAVAQDMRADYYLGNYASPLLGLRKYKKLFQLCDDAYKNDKEFGIEGSPGADAKMWEGYLAAAYAKELEDGLKDVKDPEALKKQKENVLKYYKQAFVAFGNFLKKYPRHHGGGKSYPEFLKAAENVARLQPSMAARLQQEIAKVPKPENKDENAVVEELVQPVPEEAFKNGMKLAQACMKKDATSKPATDAEWDSVRKQFQVVAHDLEPVMADKRLSSGLPKVLRYLLIANGYLGNTLKTQTLSDLGAFKFRDDPQVQNGILIAGNALWAQAERLEKAGKTAEAKALKEEAAQVYADFLTVAKSHDHAPIVAVRLAREDFTKANAEGEKLNQETNPDARAVLSHNWLTGFDRAIKRYGFVIRNFSHRPEFIDEAFERSIEAYVLTKRYKEAVALGKEYCINGSEVPAKMLNAKTDIAANLYSEGLAYEKEAAGKRLEAAAIVIPNPVKPEPPAPEAAATPQTQQAQPAAENAAAPADAPAAPAEDPQAVYEKALAQYETDVKQVKILTEKQKVLNQEADELVAQAKICYQEAITHLNEFTGQWLVKGGPYEKEMKSAAADQNRLRAASMLPWLYDGAGDMENAAKNFMAFINAYPQEKSVPQYLLRLSVLCTEMGKDQEASQVLNILTSRFPDTPEGKNAKFALAHNLYGRGNYEMALQNLNEIFSNPDLKKNLTISNYRWLASELANCPDAKFAKDAASFALRASEELVEKVKTPVVADWVGDVKAKEFEVNPAARTEFFDGLYELLLNDAATAANAMGDYGKAIKYYTDLEHLNKNTSFIYKLYFGRAKAYLSMTPKNYEKAKADLARLARRANLAGQTSIYNKAQVMIGDIWEEQGDLKKAFAMYYMVSALPFSATTVLKVDPDHPEDDTPLYLEKAVYKVAELADKVGKPEEKKVMLEKYKKYYPDGKYKVEIKNLEQ